MAGCAPTPTAAPRPEGIISMAPHHTETLFALGQGHRVIGVSRYCDYPPQIANLPKLGDYLNPDYEKIALLRPALILTGGKHEKLSNFAAMKEIPVLSLHMDSLATIDEGIAAIGVALGCEAQAKQLRAHIKSQLDELRRAVKDLPRPKVLVINNRVNHDLNSLFTIGPESFLSELIDVAGGDNIFNDSSRTYFEASKETVVLRAPEVIIEFHAWEDLSETELEAYRDDWDRMPTLPAVKNGRIYTLTETYALRPGPRVALTASKMAQLFHPNATIPTP